MAVDYETLEKILSDRGVIDDGDIITNQILELFTYHRGDKINALFIAHPFKRGYADGARYSLELNCVRCDGVIADEVSKTKVLEIVRQLKKFKKGENQGGPYQNPIRCDACCQELRRIRDQELEAMVQENTVRRAEDRTKLWDQYKAALLSPDWRKYIQYAPKINGHSFYRIKDLAAPFHDEIRAYLKSELTYRQYLKTYQWAIISWFVKYKAKFKCRLCSSTENLNTHHASYKNLGLEFNVWDHDLICICNECHKHHHHI